jgi:hypothetical protein
MASRFQVLAVNDKASFCECCGKSNLQRVVWILDTETGEEKHFGTVCALRPAKGFDCSEEIKSAIKLAKENEKRICSNAMYRYRKIHNGQMIQLRDKDGSPFSKVADWSLWQQCLQDAA